MKKKWLVFTAVVLFLLAAGFGVYLGTPSIPKQSSGQTAPVQSVAALTGYAEAEAIRSRFLGVLSRKEAVTVRLDEGREVKEFLVKTGDVVKEGDVLAVYDDASLLLEKEQLLLDKEQIAFELENANLQLQAFRQERRQADAAQKEALDLQILNVRADLEQKEYDLGRKDREIALLEENLAAGEVVSPCEGIVSETDKKDGSILVVPEESYEFSFSASEEEIGGFQPGNTVIVFSRDGSMACRGTVSLVGNGEPGEGETLSGAARASMYPVHGTVTEADGFLPGQHVYIEKEEDKKQPEISAGGDSESGAAPEDGGSVSEEEKEAGTAYILLPEGYITDASGKPWVWAAGGDGCLEKRPVVLGAYNDRHSAWQVMEGISMTDYLAYPSALLKEGQKADFGE